MNIYRAVFLSIEAQMKKLCNEQCQAVAETRISLHVALAPTITRARVSNLSTHLL